MHARLDNKYLCLAAVACSTEAQGARARWCSVRLLIMFSTWRCSQLAACSGRRTCIKISPDYVHGWKMNILLTYYTWHTCQRRQNSPWKICQRAFFPLGSQRLSDFFSLLSARRCAGAKLSSLSAGAMKGGLDNDNRTDFVCVRKRECCECKIFSLFSSFIAANALICKLV